MPTNAEEHALYFDSSALVKLIVKEAESGALRSWLGRRQGVDHVASALVRTEVTRAVRSHDDRTRRMAADRLAKVSLIAVTDRLLDEAGRVGPDLLRSLDAIHLASALRVGKRLDAVVTYNRRMIYAAQEMGLTVAHPGLTLS